jgi:hypothetical protein
MFNLKFTPELFFMLPFALILDLSGILLICFGLDDFGILDAIGIVFINLWLLLRGKKFVENTGRGSALSNLKNFFTAKETKFLTGFIEMVPYLGSILPLWTLTVLFNLTEDQYK